jgi:hypothetical protein
MSKAVKKWPGRGTDTIIYEKNIKANHDTIERRIIKRMKTVACALILSIIENPGFLAVLKFDNDRNLTT